MSELDAVPDEGEPQEIAVGRAIEDIAASLRTSHTDVAVEIDPALHGTTIRMNRELFHLAVRNLHENAVQHSPAGGRVRWFLDGSASLPMIAVEDEGPGIPEDEIGQVTVAFNRMAAKLRRHEAEMADRAVWLVPDFPDWSAKQFSNAYFMVGRYEDALGMLDRLSPDNDTLSTRATRAAALAAVSQNREAGKALAAHQDVRAKGCVA